MTDPMFDRRALLGVAGIAGVAALARGTQAGDLAPPPGPIAPTMKPLDEVEPRIPIGPDTTPGGPIAVYNITQPGSYYLTGNVLGESGKSGIALFAPNVSIDLNGFELRGVLGSFDGIRTNGGVGTRTNLRIRNGLVTNWGLVGVNLAFSGVSDTVSIEDLLVKDNADAGILPGRNAVVRRCAVVNNGSFGIAASGACRIESCLAHDNGNTGIDASSGSVVSGCASNANGNHGIRVFSSGTIADCCTRDNAGSGISAGSGCVVTRCSAVVNGSGGITVGAQCVVTDCISANNTGIGIIASTACRISDCTADANTTHGIDALQGSFVSSCVTLGNTATGIRTGFGCTVRTCTVYSNGEHGISVGTGCVVSDSHCFQNGFTSSGTGILAAGRCRVERNHCSGNFVGIGASAFGATGNVLIQNTCSANNTNYIFVNDNRYGPIVSIPTGGAPPTPSVSGSSAASTLNTTDPWANFSH